MPRPVHVLFTLGRTKTSERPEGSVRWRIDGFLDSSHMGDGGADRVDVAIAAIGFLALGRPCMRACAAETIGSVFVLSIDLSLSISSLSISLYLSLLPLLLRVAEEPIRKCPVCKVLMRASDKVSLRFFLFLFLSLH